MAALFLVVDEHSDVVQMAAMACAVVGVIGGLAFGIMVRATFRGKALVISSVVWAASRYMEMNPVRAGLVDRPAASQL